MDAMDAMDAMDDQPGVQVHTDARGVATVTLDRPEVRNAFDDRLIAALTGIVEVLRGDERVRVVVLTGAGEVFSAGADINWMRASVDRTHEENVADAGRMDRLFRALWELPKPVIGRINGHALGGGTGLTAVCDVAVAVHGARFGFTEVRLGLVPAVISPYVVRKIGRSHARALFVTGERFDTDRAARIGLVHHAVAAEELDGVVESVVEACLSAGPAAVGLSKRLPELALRELDIATADTPGFIAGARVGMEGQEGLAAFLERRRPSWVTAEPAE